jgi:hypothetical protein
MTKFRKPTLRKISVETAPEFYVAKSHLEQAIAAAGLELAKALGFTGTELYTHAMPEILARILVAYDGAASVLAATAYLESKGYRIEQSPIAESNSTSSR